MELILTKLNYESFTKLYPTFENGHDPTAYFFLFGGAETHMLILFMGKYMRTSTKDMVKSLACFVEMCDVTAILKEG